MTDERLQDLLRPNWRVIVIPSTGMVAHGSFLFFHADTVEKLNTEQLRVDGRLLEFEHGWTGLESI